jgi:hypothetical protein
MRTAPRLNMNAAAINPDTGVRVDERLGHAAAQPGSAGQPRDEIDRAQRQQLLVGVEAVAVLLSEHPANRGRFHAASTKHAIVSGRSSFRSCRLTCGSPSDGSPCWMSPTQRHAVPLEVQQSRRNDARDHREQATGRFFILSFPATSPVRRAIPTSRGMGCVSPRCAMKRDEIRAVLSEVSMPPFEAEQLGKLRARKVEREAALRPTSTISEKNPTASPGAHQPRAKAIAATTSGTHAASAA